MKTDEKNPPVPSDIEKQSFELFEKLSISSDQSRSYFERLRDLSGSDDRQAVVFLRLGSSTSPTRMG